MSVFQKYVCSNDIVGFILAVEQNIEESAKKHPMYWGTDPILCSAAAFFLLDSVYSQHHQKLIDLLINTLQTGQLVAKTERPYEDGFAFLRTLAVTSNQHAFDALYPVAEQVLNTVVSEKHSTVFEQLRVQLAQCQHERIKSALHSQAQDATQKRRM